MHAARDYGWKCCMHTLSACMHACMHGCFVLPLACSLLFPFMNMSLLEGHYDEADTYTLMSSLHSSVVYTVCINQWVLLLLVQESLREQAVSRGSL